MKKGCLITLCVVGGLFVLLILLTFLPLFNRPAETCSIQFFDEPGVEMEIQNYQVTAVISDSTALAKGQEKALEETNLYTGLTVLLYTKSGAPYYDEQTIKAGKGECFKQVGIYKYRDLTEDKTVPIISIMPIQ